MLCVFELHYFPLRHFSGQKTLSCCQNENSTIWCSSLIVRYSALELKHSSQSLQLRSFMIETYLKKQCLKITNEIVFECSHKDCGHVLRDFLRDFRILFLTLIVSL